MFTHSSLTVKLKPSVSTVWNVSTPWPACLDTAFRVKVKPNGGTAITVALSTYVVSRADNRSNCQSYLMPTRHFGPEETFDTMSIDVLLLNKCRPPQQ